MDSSASVVIVGSGIAGSLVANLLSDAGVGSIIILEAGPTIAMEDPRSWFDVLTTGKAPYEALYDQSGDYTAEGANPWVISGARIIGRGGSTIHWGGWCPRFMPEDFALKTNTGLGIDWPYGYDDLEPYYTTAESYVGVAGEEYQGQRDWRSKPYPLAAATLPLTAKPIVTALKNSGYLFSSMPLARNTIEFNGQSQCITTGTCHYCPVGARFTGDQPLDRAESRTGVSVVLNAPVKSIRFSDKQTVSGVEYVDTTSGESHTVECSALYVCAGAFESPKLLLASTSEYWPAGVGNDNDLVGRFLVANPYLYCRGGAATNPDKLQQELNFPTLASRQWDTPAEQAHGKFLMNMSYDAPLIHPGKLMYGGETAEAISNTVTGEFHYELQGALSPLPNYDNRVSLASGTTRFGLPRTSIFTPSTMVPASTITLNGERMTKLFEDIGYTVSGAGAYPQRGDHAASTCRMATSELEGVVDDTLKVFGTDNLFVASNAAIPTVGAANLTITLVAAIMRAIDKTLATQPIWAATPE